MKYTATKSLVREEVRIIHQLRAEGGGPVLIWRILNLMAAYQIDRYYPYKPRLRDERIRLLNVMTRMKKEGKLVFDYSRWSVPGGRGKKQIRVRVNEDFFTSGLRRELVREPGEGLYV